MDPCDTVPLRPVPGKCVLTRTHHSSLAIPRSLQQRMSALLLHASVAVGMPFGSKYSCSPRAMPTSLSNVSDSPSCYNAVEKYGHAPAQAHQRVLSADDLGADIRLAPRRESPPAGPERLVQYSAILDLREVEEAVCASIIHRPAATDDCQPNAPGLISTSRGSIGASKMSAASFGNGCVDSPK